jgi:outer membrane protein assembly factor BamA
MMVKQFPYHLFLSFLFGLTAKSRWPIIALLFLIATPIFSAKASVERPEGLTSSAGKIIRSIRYQGKFKLKTSILSREIDSRPGQELDSKRLERDRKKIDGLGIFSEVRSQVTDDGDSVDIVFNLTEVWTLIPLLSVGKTDNSFDWMVGAHERDLAGYLCNVRGLYRRFEGENSYVLDVVLPRTLGRDFLVGFSTAYERQKDQVFIDGIETTYRYLNKYITIDLGFRAGEKVYPGLFVGYSRENWSLVSPAEPPARARRELDYPRYFLGAALSLGRIYSDHFYYEGAQLTSGATLIRELPGNRFEKWRLQFTGRGFVVMYDINLCARLQYSTSSSDERLPPYALSGSYNVRGYRDKYDRGDHFLGCNLEARKKLIETRHWYSQAALFVDAASLWGRYRNVTEALRDPYWSFGGGLRLAFKRWPRLGRADVIFNTSTKSWTYYLSSSQFF